MNKQLVGTGDRSDSLVIRNLETIRSILFLVNYKTIFFYKMFEQVYKLKIISKFAAKDESSAGKVFSDFGFVFVYSLDSILSFCLLC